MSSSLSVHPIPTQHFISISLLLLHNTSQVEMRNVWVQWQIFGPEKRCARHDYFAALTKAPPLCFAAQVVDADPGYGENEFEEEDDADDGEDPY
jgi:hypothetical protein